jgi:hypothetical protein
LVSARDQAERSEQYDKRGQHVCRAIDLSIKPAELAIRFWRSTG